MKIRLITLAGFIKKEFIQITRDPKMIVAIFFIPVMQTVMFGLALTSEVKNIEFLVVSKPSPTARLITEHALASGWFKKVEGVNGAQVEDPSALLLGNKAEAVLVAPKEGFEYALEHGAPIQLLVNAINAQRAQQVDGYVKQIVAAAAAAKGYNLSAGFIELDTRVMFNHYMDTTDFMIPALMVMSTFLVMLVVCSMAITKEKETGTMEKLIASPASAAEILLGKTLPYFIIGLVIIFAIFFIGAVFFGVPFRGHLWQIFVTGSLLIISALGVATLLSTAAKTQQQAMMGNVLFLMPAILLSGVFFPVANIPESFRWLCYLNPMMSSVVNFRGIMLKGGDLVYFWQYCAILAVICLITCSAAYKNFRSKLN